MTRERTLTKLELVPATVAGADDWVSARWQRSDGSKGSATARFRLRTAERWYIARLLVDLPTTALLQDVPLARIEAAANADEQIRAWIVKSLPPETIKRAQYEAARRPKLKRPKSRRELDDDFYKRVAVAYRAAVAHGLPPAKTLAHDSGAPPGTVNRWIAEARKKERGHLPPAQPGKVSA